MPPQFGRNYRPRTAQTHGRGLFPGARLVQIGTESGLAPITPAKGAPKPSVIVPWHVLSGDVLIGVGAL